MKVIAFFAVALAAAELALAAPPVVDLSASDRTGLLQAAAELRSAILHGDAATFLGLVSAGEVREGLMPEFDH
jgi:hypothetical protein